MVWWGNSTNTPTNPIIPLHPHTRNPYTMSKLSIFINEQAAYDYDSGTELDDQQRAFLDRMDEDMGRGLKIHGELISEPDTHQRATFVAMNLIKALLQEDEAKIQVSCAYLLNRLPDLNEVHARDGDERVEIELTENGQG